MQTHLFSIMIGISFLGCASSSKVADTEEEDINIVVDADGDGYLADEDCNDNDGSVYLGASEICDGVDNNCDGEIDEGGICDPLLGYRGGFEWVSLNRNQRWDIFTDEDLEGWHVSWLNDQACPTDRPPVLEIQGYGLCTGTEGEIEGNNHAELDSDCQGPGGGRNANERTTVKIERMLATVAGQRYQVSFYARSRYRASGTQTIYAQWGEEALMEHPAPISWTQYTFEVLAEDTETLLLFADLGDANTLGVLLDDIEVTPIF